MALSSNLGFPRIGKHRELKRATEAYWNGKIGREELLKEAADIRRANWILQREIGIDLIPSNDFSFYDQVLDTCALVGAVPARYRWQGESVDLDTYFAMARGRQGEPGRDDVTAMEMTKWFDTNYHYLVPEFSPDQTFRLASSKPFDEFREALALGIRTKPVLIGPLTFLLLGKSREEGFNRLQLLDRLLPVYEEVLAKLAELGAEWVQIDEPALVLDRTEEELSLYKPTFERLKAAAPNLRILLAAYFEGFRENLKTVLELPIQALHLDLVRNPAGLMEVLSMGVPEGLSLSLGIVDGRNVWRNDLEVSLGVLEWARDRIGPDRLQIAPSCSLLHVPIDLDLETDLDEELRSWLAFGVQKLQEVHTLTRALNEGREAVGSLLAENARAQESRRTSPRIHRKDVQERVAAIRPEDTRRAHPFPVRREAQRRKYGSLPELPTTTIGSFPQTPEVRRMRARYSQGTIDRETYHAFLREQVEQVIRLQERVGLDVLVHGEFERNDMVQYFGEQLEGFAFTKHAWVQSYGSRYVKPPIIYGDVRRPHAMTVEWIRYADSLTEKPVKGMLTGPVTMLQWSFVRDDQTRAQTCRQIALAIRDEVQDLENAGIRVIQIDEPALREGLPLRRADWNDYLEWAVECFRLASSGVDDATQIHTHMCYAEFNDIIEAIADLDADVISIEASRSNMELLQAFRDFQYPNDIGPGVYDIHSPRIPQKEEMVQLIEKATEVLRPEQLWVNPDCGLKTRTFEEVEPALRNMVEAARAVRERLAKVG